jgi:internalin A
MNKIELDILALRKRYDLTRVGDEPFSIEVARSFKLDEKGDLIELNLDNCNLFTISFLSKFEQLESLSLQGNKIVSGSSLSSLTKLTYLNISYNDLDDISYLKGLSKLAHLNINGTKIFDLSPLYNQLKNRDIDLRISDDVSIRYPDFRNYNFDQLEVVKWFDDVWSIAKAKIQTNLIERKTVLDLGNCGLTDLSFIPELFTCTHLETLILSNEWSEYQDSGWQRIKSENSGPSNNVFYIPDTILRLRNLKVLICGGDWKGRRGDWNRWRLTSFAVFTKFKDLRYLNLSNNLISRGITLTKMQALERLHINNNLISSIAVGRKLPALEELYLSNNLIKNISFISNLPNLATLDMHSNLLEDLFHAKSLLKRFELSDSKWKKGVLNLASNNLRVPNIDVILQGQDRINDYFAQYEAEQSVQLKPFSNRDIKLVLVGNSNAGKSTLVNFLITGNWDDKISSTHWIDIKEWKISLNKRSVKVRIFDFGGQEYYHDTHYLFFTRQTAYLLLWDKAGNGFGETTVEQLYKDGSRKSTVVQNYPLTYWLDSIDYHTNRRTLSEDELKIIQILDERDKEINEAVKKGDDISNSVIKSTKAIENQLNLPNVLICQNKVDESINIDFINQEKLKAQHPRIYEMLAASIKTGRGADHLVDVLLEMISKIPVLEREYLGTWGIIKEVIEQNANTYKKEMSIQEFNKFCNDIIKEIPEVKKAHKNLSTSVLFNQNDTRSFAQYLTNIGLVLYFPEDDNLKNKIFINQSIVLSTIYNILAGLNVLKGVFDDNHILKALGKRKFDEECKTIVNLMKHFKIVIPHPALPETYIAPLYLPKEPSKTIKLFLGIFKKPVYRFLFEGFIHKHIILQFFQTFGDKALKGAEDNELYYFWRDGLIIKNGNKDDIVYVKFCNGSDKNKKTYIEVYTINSAESPFLSEIILELEKITPSDVKKAVTLNGEDFIPIEVIHAEERLNNWVFQYNHKYYKLPDFKKYLKTPIKMKKIFISYSKADASYLTKLENHLSVLRRNGTISLWNCRQLLPGEKWDGKIKKELEEADIIIFMVSDDFLATDYIWDIEIKRAIERENLDPDNVKVVPIIVRSCYWEESPLSVYNTAPKKAQVLTLAGDIDDAFKSVVLEIKKIL